MTPIAIRGYCIAAPLAATLILTAVAARADPYHKGPVKSPGPTINKEFLQQLTPQTPNADPFGFGADNPNPAKVGPGDPNFEEIIDQLQSPMPLLGVESIPPGGVDAVDKAISASDRATVPDIDTGSNGGNAASTGTAPINNAYVQSGESLAEVAARFGLTPEELATANNITDINAPLYSGQSLVLPATAKQPAAGGVTRQRAGTAVRPDDDNLFTSAPHITEEGLRPRIGIMITSNASGETVYGVYDSVTKKWVGRYRSLDAAVSLARDEREKIDKAEKSAAAAPQGNTAAQPPAAVTPVPVSITVTAAGEQREDASIVVFDSRGVPVAQGKTTKSGGRPKLNTNLPPGTYRIVTGWTDRQGRTHSGIQLYTVTTGKNETDLGVTEKGYTNPPRTGRPPNR